MSGGTKVSITNEAINSLNSLPDELHHKLFINFVQPIKLGYSVSELEGKYKPSWELPLENSSVMRKALAEFARTQDLYHYHFGYPFYKTGKDPKYFGKESDGIIHTVLKTSEKESEQIESHTIHRIDLEHPHPFTVPTQLENDCVDL